MRRAVQAMILAALCFIGQLVLLVNLINGGFGANASPRWFWVFVPSLVLCLLWGIVTPLYYREREQQLRGAVAWTISSTIDQPQVRHSLADGETLVLTREMPVNPEGLAYYIIFLAAPFFAFETGGIQLLNLPEVYTTHQSSFAIIVLCLPFLVGIILAGLLWRFGLQAARISITANDAGITLSSYARSKAFIPWSDIMVCLRQDVGKFTLPAGVYILAGKKHYLVMPLGHQELPSTKPGAYGYSVTSSLADQAQEGYIAYLEGVERLLATVVQRGQVVVQGQERQFMISATRPQ